MITSGSDTGANIFGGVVQDELYGGGHRGQAQA